MQTQNPDPIDKKNRNFFAGDLVGGHSKIIFVFV
jgi:hypothetical protein